MVWRSVVISNPARLRRDANSLLVEQDRSARVPLEDIAVIVLNHQEITLTHPVLSACAENGIGIFSTGDNHLPNGVFLPFMQHSRATRVQRLQMSLSRPASKRAWASIVQSKIRNQFRCMNLLGLDGARHLELLAQRVKSGDSQNLEAQASAYYFPRVFGKGFARGKSIWINSALNYGYAIMRGACTRAVVAHGMLPSLGLFHCNEQNAFNLADDLMEPYRALVDFHVAQQELPGDSQDLRTQDKISLIGLLNSDIEMPKGTMSVLASMEQLTQSLLRVLEGEASAVLELPTLIGSTPTLTGNSKEGSHESTDKA